MAFPEIIGGMPVQVNEVPEEHVPFADQYKAGRQLESTAEALRKIGENINQEVDPNYRLPDTFGKEDDELSGSFTAEERTAFKEAVSQEHAEIIKQRLLDERANSDLLASQGWSGVGARGLAAVTDPPTLALAIASGGLTSFLSKGPAALRVAKGAAVAGAEGAAVEGLLATNQAQRGADDIAIAAAASAFLGGGAGWMSTLSKSKALKELEKFQAEEFDPTTGARVPDSPALFATIGGRLLNSESAAVRAFSDRLLKRQVTKPGEGPRTQVAEETKTFIEAKARRVFHAAQLKWEDEFFEQYKQFGNGSRREATRVMREEAGRVARGIPSDFDGPALQGYLKDSRSILETLGKRARAAGVEGFKNLDDASISNYMTRYWNARKMLEANAKFGEGAVSAVIKGAIRNAMTGLVSDKSLNAIASGVSRTLLKKMNGLNTSSGAMTPGSSIEEFLEGMAENAVDLGLDPETAESIARAVGKIKEGANDAGNIARGKQRTLMDETYVDPETGLAIADLFDNDLGTIIPRYAADVSGQIALAEHAGITSRKGWDKAVEEMRNKAAEEGLQDSSKSLETTISKVGDFFYGAPLNSAAASNGARVGRVIRNTRFAQVMSKLVLAMIPEVFGMMQKGGFRAFALHMPEFRKVFTQFMDKPDGDDLSHDIIAMFGIGHNQRISLPGHYIEDLAASGISATTPGAKFLEGAEKLSERAANIVGRISEPLDTRMRVGTARMLIQRFADRSVSKHAREFTTSELAQIGLSQADADALGKLIRSKATIGKLGKVNRLNVDDLMEADPALTNKLLLAGRDFVGRVIQEGDFSNSYLWMHSTIGAMVTQFRSFPLQVINRQIRANFQGGAEDKLRFAAWFGMTTLGGFASYLASESIKHAGKSNYKEEMEKALDFGDPKVTLRALGRSTGASLFPDIMTTAADAQVDSFVAGPTASYANDILRSGGKLIRDPSAGQAVDSAARIVGLRHFIGIEQGLNFLVDNLEK